MTQPQHARRHPPPESMHRWRPNPRRRLAHAPNPKPTKPCQDTGRSSGRRHQTSVFKQHHPASAQHPRPPSSDAGPTGRPRCLRACLGGRLAARWPWLTRPCCQPATWVSCHTWSHPMTQPPFRLAESHIPNTTATHYGTIQAGVVLSTGIVPDSGAEADDAGRNTSWQIGLHMNVRSTWSVLPLIRTRNHQRPDRWARTLHHCRSHIVASQYL